MDADRPKTPARRRTRAAAPARVDRTVATVLRIFPFSNTSQMVVWLAEDGRRLVTSVKGAARPKSAFLGQYDLFQTCELLYYAASRDGVHVARECDAVRRRDNLRDNWRAEHCASWFSALADAAASSDAAAPALFSLFGETLDALDACPGAPPPALFARFEAKILVLLGLRPNFDPPPGAPAPGGSVRFDLAAGRIAAPAAPPEPDAPPIHHSSFVIRHSTGAPAPVVRLPGAAVSLFATLADSPSVGPGSTVLRETPPGTLPLLRFLGLFLRYHLPDAPAEGRALAVAALANPQVRPGVDREPPVVLDSRT